jgi:HAE1 family hydrophobic/amphiphilic exporter-1
MWFTRLSISNPVMATMLMLAFVVLGVISYQRLSIDQFPSVDFPTVVIATEYPGASPEVVETEVTRKVEETVNTVAGISSIYSRSYEGTSVVIVEFNLNMDGRRAAEDVREKLALLKPLLRDEVQEPRVSRFDPQSAPIFNVAVIPDTNPTQITPPPSPQALTTWASQVLKKRLENVRGVGSVSVIGGVNREINLYLNPEKLDAFGITAEQVLAAVAQENQDLPLGNIRTGPQEKMVQMNTRTPSAQAFADIIVARRGPSGQSSPIRLGQVADIQDGPAETESLALYNGQRTVLLSVQKSQDDNTIAVVDGLYQVLQDIQPQIPAGMKVEVNRDNSRSIRLSVANVKRTLIEGALLTIAIVFLFLNSWRSTVITGLTLPIALLGTFAFMDVLGFTINTITLMALSLSVGLLIDDAIVVRENIVRHIHQGKSPRIAALDGTQEIGLAVLATTFSIVAVFLPIGFMGGIIGKFFHEFGLTIVAAVLISMFVSFTLDPMLSSVWHDPMVDPAARPITLYDRTLGRLTGAVDRLTWGLSQLYADLLAWSLHHRLKTLGVAVATLLGSFALVPVLGTEFVPKVDYSETQIQFYATVGSAIEVTEDKARRIDQALRQLPEVRYTVTTINSGMAAGKIYGSVYVRLTDRAQRQRSTQALTEPMRQLLSAIPGITITNIGPTDLGGGKSLQFSLQGPNLQILSGIAQQVMGQIQQIPGLVDLDSTLKPSKPTVDIDLQREAMSDAGLSVQSVSNQLRILLAGRSAGSWRAPDDENYAIKVRLLPAHRTSVEALRQMPMAITAATDGNTRLVRLGQMAEVRESQGANQINRRDLNREINIDANAIGRSTGEVSADIQKILSHTPFPPGYRFTFGGATKNMKESFSYALVALLMAVIFIYMILASQFHSFIQPLSLMSSLPLTLIGVVLALLLFGSTLNMFSIIGIVMLMGLVTKNAILLIDFALRARADGMARTAALIEAAKVRLRPILMTTLAMIFGMVPLAFALSEGSEHRAPMGQAVIGGVITSSLLTLVVVPVIYTYLDDFSNWLRRRWHIESNAA